MLLSELRPDDLPVSLGQLTLTVSLGEGSTGHVFRAETQGVGGFPRVVAVAVLRRGGGRPDQSGAWGGLLPEVQRARQLRHRGIVQTFSCGERDGSPFVVTELVDGVGLEEFVRQAGPLLPRNALDVGIQVCAALAHAHSLGEGENRRAVVHGDLRPSRVMVGMDGVVKLRGFGLGELAGRAPGAPSPALPRDCFAAPEVLGGKPAEAASDLFSLGAILAWSLIGEPPFPAPPLAAPAQRVAALVQTLARRDLQRRLDGLAEGLGELIQRMVALDPRRRQAKASEAEAAMRELRGRLPQGPKISRLVLDHFGGGSGTVAKRGIAAPPLSPPPAAAPLEAAVPPPEFASPAASSGPRKGAPPPGPELPAKLAPSPRAPTRGGAPSSSVVADLDRELGPVGPGPVELGAAAGANPAADGESTILGPAPIPSSSLLVPRPLLAPRPAPGPAAGPDGEATVAGEETPLYSSGSFAPMPAPAIAAIAPLQPAPPAPPSPPFLAPFPPPVAARPAPAIGDAGIAPPPPGPLSMAGAPAATWSPPPPAAPEARRQPRRRGGVARSTALAVILLGTAFIILRVAMDLRKEDAPEAARSRQAPAEARGEQGALGDRGLEPSTPPSAAGALPSPSLARAPPAAEDPLPARAVLAAIASEESEPPSASRVSPRNSTDSRVSRRDAATASAPGSPRPTEPWLPAGSVDLSISHRPVAAGASGSSDLVSVRVEGPPDTEVVLWSGPRGGPHTPSALRPKSGGRWEGWLRFDAPAGGEIEYWIVASHPAARGPATSGSSEAPHRVGVR
jgi:serine/threonine-protein kinase